MKRQKIGFIFMILLLISAIPGCLLQDAPARAAGSQPSFAKKPGKLTVGKTLRFSLRGVKKSWKIVYSSSQKKVAAIGRKSGKCTAKKPGTTIIRAKVYNKKGKRIATRKHRLRVVKNTLLPNASFRPAETINPYNYTIKLKCSRILLKREVKKSKLTLKRKGSSSAFSAVFSQLSSSGKEVTYTLTAGSRKKLSPRDGTMDGTYTLTSPLFSKKLSLSYQERIGNYSLSGYVLTVEGAPVNNACVKLLSDGASKTCRTDSHGFYRIKNARNPNTLTVSKQGYYTETLSSLSTSRYTTYCENILLRPNNQNGFSARFQVKEEDGTPIPKASVYLFPHEERESQREISLPGELSLPQDQMLFSGETDGEGNLLLYTASMPKSGASTVWRIGDGQSLTWEHTLVPGNLPAQKISPLSPEKKYTLLVGTSPGEGTPGRGFRKLTFCPGDYLSPHFFFSVTLPSARQLSLNNLSIKWDRSEEDCSQIDLSLYQSGEVKPIISTSLTSEYFAVKDHLLTFSRALPCTVPNGSYYLRVQCRNKEGDVISLCPLTPLDIAQGKCSPRELSALSPACSRILIYSESTAPENTASFYRFQLLEGQYFYLDKLTTSPFRGEAWEIKTASLLLSCTEAGASYLLLPGCKQGDTDYGFSYSPRAEEIFFGENRENAALNAPPLGKIQWNPTCEADSSFPSSPLFPNGKSQAWVISQFAASKSYVRSSPSYPNSVTVYYKREGTFLSASLTVSSSKNIAAGKDILLDIYTNGKPLFTTQENYS